MNVTTAIPSTASTNQKLTLSASRPPGPGRSRCARVTRMGVGRPGAVLYGAADGPGDVDASGTPDGSTKRTGATIPFSQ